VEHHFLDRYSHLDSPIHRLDPRVKIVSAFAFILIVVSRDLIHLPQASVWLALILVPTLLSRVPLLWVLKRSLIVIPFVLIIGIFIPFMQEGEAVASVSLGALQLNLTLSGLELLKNILIKAYLSILALILLTSTSRFSDLSLAMQKLRFPRILLLSTSFMYRYLFVLADEMMKMDMGRKARQTRKRSLKDFRILGRMIGILFIRSFERGERIYQAMLARGFSGKFRSLRVMKLRVSDIVLSLAFVTATALVGWRGWYP